MFKLSVNKLQSSSFLVISVYLSCIIYSSISIRFINFLCVSQDRTSIDTIGLETRFPRLQLDLQPFEESGLS